MMTLAQAHALLPGSTLVGDGSIELLRVHSDTRSLRPGDLFVALRGERFDAHQFLPQARAQGAAAAIAEHGLAEAGLPGLQVADSLQALQQLAQAWRHRLHLPVAAVTGSNGKTTVTQMLASVLRAWQGDHALATAGNLNNHIGLPLMLLRLRQDDALWHRAAVFEIGMNHPGEVAELARLAQPTVALINNAQREHQEFMHSVEAVARENGSVIAALPLSGTVVIPAADAFAPLWQQLAGSRRVIRFGLDGNADVDGSARWQGEHWALTLHTPAGPLETRLSMAGRHNALNAAAAAATAVALGVPLPAVSAGLAAFQPVAGRSALRHVHWRGQALTLVDDSYNANPDSVAAAIAVLQGLPGPRWLVLGDMAEVGSQGPAFHEEAGALARAAGIEALWCAGAAGAHTARGYGAAARAFADVPALLAALHEAPPCSTLLVKGSRSMQMERVVSAIALTAGGGHHAA